MKGVLITGADGFIGQALCQTLVRGGHSIRGVVRHVNSRTSEADIPGAVRFHEVGGIGSDTDWSEALNGIDTVVHLAARVHLMDDRAADPLAAFRKVNVAGTKNLAEAAARHGVKRLVFLSSAKVNGERTDEKPFTEQAAPSPKDPYAVSKWEAEQAVRTVSAETGLEVVILRSPLVYGPGVKANFLRLMQLIDRNIPLPFASVDNHRSMICLRNLTDAIAACCVSPKARGETFLVSDGDDVSTPELVRMIASAMRRKARLFSIPQSLLKLIGTVAGKRDELDRLVGSFRVDSSKIREALHWKPSVTLKEGILETVKWYEARI